MGGVMLGKVMKGRVSGGGKGMGRVLKKYG